MRILFRFATLTAFLCLALTWSVGAQNPSSVLGLLAMLDLSTLIPPDDPIFTDQAAIGPATNDPPHLPPGTKFKLIGSAKDDLDPLNASNEVISTDPVLLPPAQQTPNCSPFCNTFGDAITLFGDHVKIGMLTNMIAVSYYFPSRTCGGGSPRIQLAISTDGGGRSDGNAHGYVGHTSFGGGCLTGVWDYVNLTDNVPARWDLTQFGGGYQNWPGVVSFFNTNYPNHRVLSAALVDDSGWFPAAAGCAYYDNVTAGARTLTGREDTSNRGQQYPNNC